MGLLTNRYYEAIKDYLHPNIHRFVNHYRYGDHKVKKNGTRKTIKHEIGEQCLAPTNKPYWKETKNKYKHGVINRKRQYWTRYMTWAKQRYLFKNKGNFVYIISLKNLNICQKRQCGMIMNIYKELKKTH